MRGGKRAHEHEFDPPDVGIVWAVADATGQRVSGEVEVGRPGNALFSVGTVAHEYLLRCKCPVLGKHLQQLCYDRPAELEMHVADGMPGTVREPAAVPDVETAGEARRAVDDENLAVVAEVGVGEIDRHRRGKESLDPHPFCRQQPHDRGPGVSGADAVDEHADSNATADGAGQRGNEQLSGRVVVEDVGGHADAAGCAVDRGEHSRIGLVAPNQRLDRVAVHQWPAGHLPHERRQRPQRGVIGADRCAESVGGGLRGANVVHDGLLAGPQLAGPRSDPVHAEHGVGDRSEDGGEPDEPDPADRGPRVTLDENRVRGGDDVDDENRPSQHVRPEHEPPPPCRRDEVIHKGDMVAGRRLNWA